MDTTHLIQISLAIATIATLLVVLYQTIIQNRLYRAQVMMQRIEMYNTMNQSPTEEVIDEIELFPDDFFDMDIYEKRYQGNRPAIRRYYYMFQVYEYLMFSHRLQSYKLLYMDTGQKRYLGELVTVEEFMDVHAFHGYYYPEFSSYVNNVHKEATSSPSMSRPKKGTLKQK